MSERHHRYGIPQADSGGLIIVGVIGVQNHTKSSRKKIAGGWEVLGLKHPRNMFQSLSRRCECWLLD